MNNKQGSGVTALLQKKHGAVRSILRPIYQPIRRLMRFARWSIPSIAKLLRPHLASERRILVIYDTSSQPFSVGDLLILQEAALVLCDKHRVSTVDFAIVYDPQNPASSDPVFAQTVTEDNVLYHIASLLPLAQVNQNLGSFFVFNSHEQIQRFITDNVDRYHVWPSGWRVATREYLSAVIFNDLLRDHYKQHHSIPHLTCRLFLQTWADNFYREQVGEIVPVTINIRNNQAWHQHRNSQMDSWIALFQYCESQYPVKFIVICARSEIDDRMRKCGNVIFAKDHYTSVEQDMALIATSAMHMGAGSGPATMAWFSNKPYLMVNTEYKTGEFYEHSDMIQQTESHIQQFWFASPNQRIAKGAESPDLLIKEFTLLWQSIDQARWVDQTRVHNGGDMTLQTWLR
jgi:hypothetical protein